MRLHGIGKIGTGLKHIVGGLIDFLLFAPEDLRLWANGRNWQLDLGPIDGKAGEKKTIYCDVGFSLFRAEKLMAVDYSILDIPDDKEKERNGFRTRISNIFVGVRWQSPLNQVGMLTAFFANNALGNSVKWDTAHRGDKISMEIEFVKDGRFDATVFGTAVP